MRISAPLRLVLLSLCLLATAALSARGLQPEVTALRQPLRSLPLTWGPWIGHDAPAFGPAILAQLGVDEYINRVYVDGDRPLSLYVGYYQSQREGDTIHSPQNCLPGAGWLPVSTSRLTLSVTGRAEPITINRMLIQKGADRQVVLFWYQSHGRVVASDYLSKTYLIYDAVRHNRSDAAMVRVISPVMPGEGGDVAAEHLAVSFVEAIFPQLDAFLPS